MISPQLHPESASSRPPADPDGLLNVTLEQTLATPPAPTASEARLVVAMGADVRTRATTDAIVNGLWHCLLGSVAAGLAVSALLGVLVLAIGQIG